ncbi:hypothetical protein [Novosphingobium kunmingense]|nr:hypothetical protein [Novosphingobium kunmingense]
MAVYALMIAAWMIDFRVSADSAVSGLQVIFLIIFLVMAFAFVVLDRDPRFHAPGMLWTVAAATLFMIAGFLSGMLRNQSYDAMIRNVIPTFVYVTTFYATVRVVMSQDLRRLRKLLAIMCLGYVVSGVLVYWAIEGRLDLSNVRFQILSGATIAALSYVECLVLFGLTMTEWGALVSGLAAVFLSVTRTFLVTALFQFVSLVPGAFRLFSRRVIVLSGAALILVAAAATVGAFGVARWTDRLATPGSERSTDATLFTRQSETRYMLDAFTANAQSVLIGNGLAAETTYYLPNEIGGGAAHSVGFGHNQHVSILFIAGLLGGGMLLFVHLVQMVQSFRFMAALSRLADRHSDLLFLCAWGALMIIGAMATNSFSSILGNRSASVWYGLGTGLFIGGRARYFRECAIGAEGLAWQRLAMPVR